MGLLHDRLYYRPSELANRWNVSIDFLMQLGLTNQLKFKAEVDWYYPTTQTIYRSSHVQVDYEELANIYYAPTSFDVEAYAGEVQNPPGVLPGDPCIITYYPGVERLLIDAAEVNDYEKCHQESLHQPTVAESLANWSNDDEFERLAPKPAEQETEPPALDKIYHRLIKRWLYDFWIENKKPNTQPFFRLLKTQKGVKGSPIEDHWGAGSKDGGFHWKIGDSEDDMSYKRLGNIVSEDFKKRVNPRE